MRNVLWCHNIICKNLMCENFTDMCIVPLHLSGPSKSWPPKSNHATPESFSLSQSNFLLSNVSVCLISSWSLSSQGEAPAKVKKWDVFQKSKTEAVGILALLLSRHHILKWLSYLKRKKPQSHSLKFVCNFALIALGCLRSCGVTGEH